MKKVVLLSAMITLSSVVASVQAGDAVAGKETAKTCAGCHGQNGISNNDLWPNLKGQKKGYLIKQLKDFKSGVRKDAQMSYWAKSLSDADIENVAEYFSTLK